MVTAVTASIQVKTFRQLQVSSRNSYKLASVCVVAFISMGGGFAMGVVLLMAGDVTGAHAIGFGFATMRF
jgi:hypothetical protein